MGVNPMVGGTHLYVRGREYTSDIPNNNLSISTNTPLNHTKLNIEMCQR